MFRCTAICLGNRVKSILLGGTLHRLAESLFFRVSQIVRLACILLNFVSFSKRSSVREGAMDLIGLNDISLQRPERVRIEFTGEECNRCERITRCSSRLWVHPHKIGERLYVGSVQMRWMRAFESQATP